MQVDNPQYGQIGGRVWCEHCPFTDADGNQPVQWMVDACNRFGVGRLKGCPTDSISYAEACKLAEKEVTHG